MTTAEYPSAMAKARCACLRLEGASRHRPGAGKSVAEALDILRWGAERRRARRQQDASGTTRRTTRVRPRHPAGRDHGRRGPDYSTSGRVPRPRLPDPQAHQPSMGQLRAAPAKEWRPGQRRSSAWSAQGQQRLLWRRPPISKEGSIAGPKINPHGSPRYHHRLEVPVVRRQVVTSEGMKTPRPASCWAVGLERAGGCQRRDRAHLDRSRVDIHTCASGTRSSAAAYLS